MAVHLEWVGMACFRLWQDGARAIAMDPYTPAAIGLVDDGSKIQADTVIASSLTDVAHGNVGLIAGEPRVINALDVGARSWRDAGRRRTPGDRRGGGAAGPTPTAPTTTPSTRSRRSGLWFLHMGDLGYGLDAAQPRAPSPAAATILLALTGEGLTLTLDELEPMIDILSPTWIVPMHYNLAAGQRPRSG